MKLICLMAQLALLTTLAQADLDPELAPGSSTNASGVYLSPRIDFGIAMPTASGSGGMSNGLGVEFGMIGARGYWGLLRGGVDLDIGTATFRLDQSPSAKIQFLTGALKLFFGHGYSLGNNLFGVTSVAIGPSRSYFKSVSNSIISESKSANEGYILGIGYDFMFRSSESIGFSIGYHLEHSAIDIGTVRKDGMDVSLDETIQFNTHNIRVGVSIHI